MTYRRTRAAVAVVALLALPTESARSEIIEQILVKVNGEIFTKSDLETRQVQMLRQRGQQIDLKSERSGEELRRALNEITPNLLVDVIDEMLVVQRGKELGYRLSDEQFASVLDNIKKENKIETNEQFQAALKQENMSMADLRRQIERSMIVQRVQQNEVFGRIGITDEEARKYYDEHINEFTTPATVMLREILIAVPTDPRGVNAAADDAAKDKASAVRRRVAAGESFEIVAADVSDAPSKANGGLIGPINVNDLSNDFRKMVEQMKAGEVTDVLRTPRGYQILKLESASEAQVTPFEQAREQISERVFTEKRRQEFQKYMVKLRSQAIIEWKNDDVKRAYDEGLAARSKQSAAVPPAL
jgi:peptidyl-prolyl cis-trans isomerase SurA